jgi:hypothetical protein
MQRLPGQSEILQLLRAELECRRLGCDINLSLSNTQATAADPKEGLDGHQNTASPYARFQRRRYRHGIQ